MYKALILGCGNIGALYDMDTDAVLTYAKAFYLDHEIQFDVYDPNFHAAQKVAECYGAGVITQVKPSFFDGYDIVAICTPTYTHHQYLVPLLEKSSVPLVMCEKPVDVDRDRLATMLQLHQQSRVKVMVNFFRRFQGGMQKLKRDISDALVQGACLNIVVTYQRGLHNNASHAVDLLEFLFDFPIDMSAAVITSRIFDEFDSDPTASLCCNWMGAQLQIIGLSNVEFSHFEIGLYFARKAYLLKEGGNRVEEYDVYNKPGTHYPNLVLKALRDELLKDYMVDVVSHAKHLLQTPNALDNFVSSVRISDNLLKLIRR